MVASSWPANCAMNPPQLQSSTDSVESNSLLANPKSWDHGFWCLDKERSPFPLKQQ